MWMKSRKSAPDIVTRFLLLAFAAMALVSFGIAAAQQPEAQVLSETELRQLVTGRMMKAVNARGQLFEDTYLPDGRMNATSTKSSGGCCVTDSGRWTIEDNWFCRQYDHWRDNQKICIQIGRRVDGEFVNMETGAPMVFVSP